MNQTPCAETYGEVENMLFDMVHKYRRKAGGDFEELMSEARIAYMNAYRAFDRKRGTAFVTLLWWAVKRRLQDVRTRQIKRDSALRMASITEKVQVEDKTPKYNWENLSDDANEVIRIVFNTPKEICGSFDDLKRSPSGSRWRSAIRNYLLELGWAEKRVLNCFSEIGEIINGSD